MYHLVHDALTLKFQSLLFSDEAVVYYVPRTLALRKRHEKCSATSEPICPFQNFWRTGSEFDWTRFNASAAHRGVFYATDSGESTGTKAPMLPVNLMYDSTLWLEREEHAIATEKLIWSLKILQPTISIEYGGEDITIPIFVEDTVDQGSEVEERFMKGRLYTVDFRFRVPAWVIYDDATVKEILTIYKSIYDLDHEDLLLDSETITSS